MSTSFTTAKGFRWHRLDEGVRDAIAVRGSMHAEAPMWPNEGRFVDERSSLMAKKGQRTTHWSVSGTKLYAVRDAKGQFKDIQTYKRAHGQDIKRSGKKEK